MGLFVFHKFNFIKLEPILFFTVYYGLSRHTEIEKALTDQLDEEQALPIGPE